MYKLTTKTTLIVSNGFNGSGSFKFAPEEFLKSLEGVTYDADFGKIVEFIEFSGPELLQPEASITLNYNKTTKFLEATSVFNSQTELDHEELASFKEAYDGQMSDGYGSVMNQYLSKEHGIDFEVYWLYEDEFKSEIEQKEIKSFNLQHSLENIQNKQISGEQDLSPSKSAYYENSQTNKVVSDIVKTNKVTYNKDTLVAIIKSLIVGFIVYLIFKWIMK